MQKLASFPEQSKQSLRQAMKFQQNGKFKAAERLYRKILKVDPRHTDALQFLAILLQQRGNSKAATHYMQQAIKTSPENPHLLSNQAEVYRMQGDHKQAEKYARQAFNINPELVDPMVIIANSLQNQGDFNGATDFYKRALGITPNATDIRNELGNVLSAQKRFQDAVIEYQQALKQCSEFDECRLNLADTLIALEKFESAILEYRNLLKRKPTNLNLMLKLAQALINNNQPDEAKSVLDDAYRCDKHNPLVLYWLGIYCQTIGSFEQSSTYFKEAIELGPDNVDAWYRLSLNREFEPTNEQIESLKSRFQKQEAITPEDPGLISLGFSLARFFEQQNSYEQSFQYYQKANSIKSRLEPFDGPRHDEQIENIINIFDADFLAQRSSWGNPSRLPVFIVGMPRSGTTLVEQIISTHPSAHGGGELPMMLDLISNLKQKQSSPAKSHAHLVAKLTQREVNELSNEYLSELRKLNDTASIIIDKLPGNYFRLGVILLLFPNARIINCSRHAVATCWSCYQQNFERGLRFANDFDHLALVYKGYQRLIQHWKRIKATSIYDLQYETLIEDPHKQCQGLLKFCGLDWDPIVLEYHYQQRPVSTASVWQVRQPIDRTAINRWKSFEPNLQDLKTRLNLE